MKYLKYKFNIISQEVFQFSLIAYIILILIEMLKEGFVSSFLNINILLGIVLISGLIMVITHNENDTTVYRVTGEDIQNGIILSIALGFGVYFMTKQLGIVSIVVASLVGIVLFLMTILFYLDQK